MKPSHMSTPRCLSDATFSTGYPGVVVYRRPRPYGRVLFLVFVALALAFISGRL